MPTIQRRTILGAVGATALLAACGKDAANDQPIASTGKLSGSMASANVPPR